jgi:hypothetical protein
VPGKTFQLSLHVRPDLLENFARDKHSSLFDLFACDKEKSAERDKRSSFEEKTFLRFTPESML